MGRSVDILRKNGEGNIQDIINIFMLLKFFYEYFKLVPEDVLWNCDSKDKHFYTKADIDRIYNKKEWDPNWIYTDPDESLI